MNKSPASRPKATTSESPGRLGAAAAMSCRHRRSSTRTISPISVRSSRCPVRVTPTRTISNSGRLMYRRVITGLGLFLSVLVRADPVMVATESFPYANGSLIGRGPATGFIDPWQNQGSDASSGFNVSQGQAQGYGTLALYRSDLGATYGTPGTQIQFSF